MKLRVVCMLAASVACSSSVGLAPYRVEPRYALPGKAGALRDEPTSPPGVPGRGTPVPVVEHAQLASGVPVFVLSRHDMPTVSFSIVTLPSTRAWRPVDELLGAAAECAVYDHDDGRSGKALTYWNSRHTLDVSSAGIVAWSSYLAPVATSALDLWLDFLGSIDLDRDSLTCVEAAAAARHHDDHDSQALARRALVGNVFVGEHPLGAWGAADLERIAVDRIRQRAKEAFLPSRTAIVAVGDITLPEVVRVAARRWGERSTIAPAEPPADGPLPPSMPFLTKDVPTSNGVFVSFGAVGVGPRDPSFAAQRVALALLEDEMYQRLRIQRGEVYSLGVDHALGRIADVSSFGVHVPAARVQPTLDVMAAVLAERLAEPAKPADLKKARESARSQFLGSLGSNASASYWIARVWSAGLDPTKLEHIASAVDGVDAEAVRAYLRTYWAPRRVSYAVVGPLGNAHEHLHVPE